MINLIKKDILLIKKYLLIATLFAIIAPVFVSTQNNLGSYSIPSYLISNVILLMMLNSSIALVEYKSNSDFLFKTLPYNTIEIILSKYITFLTLMLSSFILFLLSNFVYYREFPAISVKLWVLAHIFQILLICIYLPLQLYFGIQNIQYVISVLVVLSPIVIKLFISNNKFTTIEQLLNSSLFFYFSALICLILMIISVILSYFIQEKKTID